MAVGTHPNHRVRTLPPELYARLDDYIDGLGIRSDDPRRAETLSQSLRMAQTMVGYLPEEIQTHIADRYAVSAAVVSGVVSFYNYFTTTPRGKTQVSVCMGTACYVNGADKVLHECEQTLGIASGEVTEDGRFSIESLRCLGVCGRAPVVTVNEKIYGDVQPAQVKALLQERLTESQGNDEADRAQG